MQGYKANVVQWTHENDFETLDETIVGKLSRHPDPNKPWAIAWQVEPDDTGMAAVRSKMVDKETVETVEMRKVTDNVKKVYWFEENAE